jgi:hypothetical protein
MNKYNAKKVRSDGYVFDSQAEHRRYCELKLLATANEVSDLRIHPKYVLHAGADGKKIGSYSADFAYNAGVNETLVIEDVKGVRTPLYKWKKKHFEAEYNLKITEVQA